MRTSCINEGEITLLDPEYEGYLNIFIGDQVNVTGRVGVCRNGSYDSVCDVNWDANDAAVLCRTIIPRKIILETTLFLYNNMIIMTSMHKFYMARFQDLLYIV